MLVVRPLRRDALIARAYEFKSKPRLIEIRSTFGVRVGNGSVLQCFSKIRINTEGHEGKEFHK